MRYIFSISLLFTLLICGCGGERQPRTASASAAGDSVDAEDLPFLGYWILPESHKKLMVEFQPDGFLFHSKAGVMALEIQALTKADNRYHVELGEMNMELEWEDPTLYWWKSGRQQRMRRLDGEELVAAKAEFDAMNEIAINGPGPDAPVEDRLRWMTQASLDNVRTKLEAEPHWLELRARDFQTALHYACQSAKVELVQLLIDKGAKLDAGDRLGRNALHHAVGGRSPAPYPVLEVLLESGIDINAKDEDGANIIFRANDPAGLDWLLTRGAKFDFVDKHGRSIIFMLTFKKRNVSSRLRQPFLEFSELFIGRLAG